MPFESAIQSHGGDVQTDTTEAVIAQSVHLRSPSAVTAPQGPGIWPPLRDLVLSKGASTPCGQCDKNTYNRMLRMLLSFLRFVLRQGSPFSVFEISLVLESMLSQIGALWK